MRPAYGAASVYIPDKGWFIFGGNTLSNASQKLVDVNASWVDGLEGLDIRGTLQCVVKVMLLFNFFESSLALLIWLL